MLAAARAGRFRTLYFESLSRLARESVITMPMLKELVYLHRVRIISVSEGIDSSQNNWELMASFMSWVHEQYLKALRAAVLRGQEEAILNDWSVGDWPLGYASEPIPDSEKGRKGRHPRPRKRVVICEEHAQWVRRVFQWFVVEKQSLDWIARELTRLNAPKDHRATTPGWHHDYVKRLLRNEKYIGIWLWGRHTNVRNPLTGQIMQEERPPEEAAKWVRESPHLRLIEDATFFQAQAFLDEFEAKWEEVRKNNGRLHGSKPGSQSPRHLLQQLIRCAACGSTFQVNGANGKYLGCSGYKRGLCRCKTRLPRQLAEQRLLGVISSRIFAQPAWLEAVAKEARQAWERRQRQEPTELAEVERKLTALTQSIKRLIDAVEQGEGGVAELDERLRLRQKEKQQLEQQRACLRATTLTATEPPTPEWIESKLRHLQDVLQAGGAEANATLRQLIGGQVVVEEAMAPGRKRRHLTGKFILSTRGVLANPGESRMAPAADGAVATEEVVVAFHDDPPWAGIADEVKNRFDAGLEYERIAEELRCPRSWVAKAMAWWHQLRDLPVPDGRQNRQRLQRPTRPEELADRAKALWDEALPMQEIAQRLDCNRDTVTAAIRHWFASRHLPIPDGRHRRKELRREREAR